MKKLYIIAWSLFFAGLVLKFLHIVGANILLLVSCTILLVHNIIFLCKHVKTDYAKVLIYFSYTFITIYVMGRILFWAVAKPIFPITFVLVIISLIVHLIKNESLKLPQIVLAVYFIFFLVFSYVPSYKVCYALKLNTVLNKEERKTDYRAWDNYSWFLNLRNKKSEALDANKKAQEAAELCGAQLYLDILEHHKLLIINNQKIEWEEWNE